jgi:hypothetical protein
VFPKGASSDRRLQRDEDRCQAPWECRDVIIDKVPCWRDKGVYRFIERVTARFYRDDLIVDIVVGGGGGGVALLFSLAFLLLSFRVLRSFTTILALYAPETIGD